MPAQTTTVNAYLAALPDDRREALDALRRTINDNLNPGFEEGMQYGMPAWFIPHSVYPAGYHCDRTQPVPFAGIASQKNHIAIHLFCVYMTPALSNWFKSAWEREHAKGRAARLDMGKGCIRVKRLSDIPLTVIAEAIRRVTLQDFLAVYEANIPPSKRPRLSPDSRESLPKAEGSRRKSGKSSAKSSAKKVAKVGTAKVARPPAIKPSKAAATTSRPTSPNKNIGKKAAKKSGTKRSTTGTPRKGGRES